MPKARQNISSGMVGDRKPVGVKPSGSEKWPSWKIQTIAPNAADNESVLSTIALSGRTTLPVKRNSTTRVDTMISARASGSRLPSAFNESWFAAVGPANSTSPGGGTERTASSWRAAAEENGSALLTTRRYAPDSFAISGSGDATREPDMNVPTLDVTASMPGIRDSSAA